VATAIDLHPLLRKYFRILNTSDLITQEFRCAASPMPLMGGLAAMDEAWHNDEFVVDASRLTMYIGAIRVDGDTFRHPYLIDGHGIEVNKTSRNSVLFMTNIGTSRSSVASRIDVLVKLAEAFESAAETRSPRAKMAHSLMVSRLPKGASTLPDFSSFATRFRTDDVLPDGCIRTAYLETTSLTPASTSWTTM
jgi:arginine decarboxylase